MATAMRSAASSRSSISVVAKTRRLFDPMLMTPITRPPTTRGTSSRERIPASIGWWLIASSRSMSAMAIDRRSAATRPASPLPIGTRTRCSTSLSNPVAARTTRPVTSADARGEQQIAAEDGERRGKDGGSGTRVERGHRDRGEKERKGGGVQERAQGGHRNQGRPHRQARETVAQYGRRLHITQLTPPGADAATS